MRGTSRIPNEMVYEQITINTNEDIANYLKNYFSSVHTLPSDILANDFIKSNNLIDVSHIFKEVILLKLKNLDINKGAGPDDIPPSLLRS